MPQEADNTGIILVMWIAWIYWNIYLWLDYMSSLERAKNKQPANDFATSPVIEGTLAVRALVPADLNALISEILRRDGAAGIGNFLDDRLYCYEAIVAAFDAGNREMLHRFVCPDVFDAFSDAIAKRESQHQQPAETVFSKVEPPEIISGLIDDEHMEVCVRFSSEAFTLDHDGASEPDGRAPHRRQCVDIWTFARAMSAPRGIWLLTATEAGA